MDFRALGRLEAYRDGQPLALGSFRQRSLLALLLMHAGEVISTDRLIDELWGASGGPDRQNALWVHVSNLRSALEPDRKPRSEGSVVLTRAPGYVLQAGADEVDASRFERLLQEGRLLLESDPAAASLVLGEGLALWRGRPYEDVAYESFAQAEIGRLEELRDEAVELRLDADLRRGLAAELVGELEGLVRQHPVRERLTGLLMLALYRSGRRADALKAYRRLRTHLLEELGLEPSSALGALEGRMLAQDPTLDRAGGAGPRDRVAVRGYELREELGEGPLGTSYRAYQPLVGREVAIKVARPAVANDPTFIQRFEAEAELVARLEHPNIVPLYDFWREPDAAYLVQRLFRSGSLADAVRHAALDLDAAGRLATDLGSALVLAHHQGVVHGDIKPSNVLLDADGRAYLTDFAIAAATSRLGPTTAPAGDLAFSSPEQRSGADATFRSDVYGLGAVIAYALAGSPPGAAATDMLAGGVGAVLRQATATDPEQRYADIATFLEALHRAGAAPVADLATNPDNPYKGLRSFEEADAADFFGRERLVERLVSRLGESGSRGRFVAVVGPSGSGKSSVVSAGLLPALRRGAVPGSGSWFVVTVTPGANPFEAFEAALLRIAIHPPVSLLEQLTADESGIRRAVRQVLPDPRSQLLVVVDQFEELFTQAPEPATRAFLDALAAAVEDPHGQLRVVITLRADFYDRPLGHRAVGELLRRGTEVITPMSPGELERAIDGPAERVGVRVDRGVVAAIVADVADRASALPLLQYALTELFDGRRGNVLDVTTYEELGGVSGALARRAEDLYDHLDPATRRLTRQLLLRLVVVGDGGEVNRRRVLRHDLVAISGRQVEAVLALFGRHRLLTFDRDPVSRGPTVEIAHEALLAAWSRLARWIDEDREDLRQRRRLASAAIEWEAGGHDDGYLLRGAALDQLDAWSATTGLALHPTERAYLKASLAHHEEERSSDETRRRREGHLSRQTRRRARLLAVSAVVLALVATLAGVAVVKSRHAASLADELAVTDEARRLAAASVNSSHDPQLATLLALQALEASADAGLPALPEAEDAVQWAIQGAAVTYPVADAPVDVRFGPNGRTGVFDLPLDETVQIARSSLTRRFAPDECATFELDPCPADGSTLATPASDGPRHVPAEAERAPVAAGPMPLAGTTVSLWGLQPPTDGLSEELERFEDATGIQVEYRIFDTHLDPFVNDPANASVMPDLALLPAQGVILDLAARGVLVDLGTFLDTGAARRAFSDYLIDSVTEGDGFYALPVQLDQKGLVWYPKPEFEAAGYEVPATWDELIALSEQMVADGRQPWCLGLESGDASGWPATDWIESLVLRLGGVDLYDRWVNHEVPFEHPVVRKAAQMFGDVAFGPGFVGPTPAAANLAGYIGASAPMLADPPGCWMYSMANYFTTSLPPSMVAGIDVGAFELPPVTEGAPSPVLGSGRFASAYHDRPEVRELLRFIMDPSWGTAWAAIPGSPFLPANAGFDPQRCGTAEEDPRVAALRVQLCTTTRDAIAAGIWRYDGSDLMPPEVGAGAFWSGMVDYVAQGPASLDRILAGIDAAWP